MLLNYMSAYNGVYYKRGDHIVIRCPFCGDSIKNSMHAHLYIEPNKGVFWCARCYEGGSLTWLLHNIRDRFDIDISPLITYYRTQSLTRHDEDNVSTSYDYTRLFQLKQRLIAATMSKYKDYVNMYLVAKGIVLDDEIIMNLPFIMLDVARDYLETKPNIENSLLVATMGARLIYRFDYLQLVENKDTHGKRFMYLNLKTDNKHLKTYTHTIFVHSNLDKLKAYAKINTNRKRILVAAEGITDLLAFLADTRLEATYLSLNGKYFDKLMYFDRLFNHMIILVDNDNAKQEFIYCMRLSSSVEFIVPKLANDYCEQTRK